MVLKEGPLCADSGGESSPKGKVVFKLRRRTVATATGSDLPFCTMCGQHIRVDAASGRCALGHRVLAVQTFAPLPASDETSPIGSVEAVDETAALPVADAGFTSEFTTEPLPVFDAAPGYGDGTSGYAGEGLYEAYQSADAAAGHSVTWDDVVAPNDSGIVYDDYVAWDEPSSGFSSLDVDTAALPGDAVDEFDAAGSEPEIPSYEAPITPLNELLEELDDAATARRKAVGTIGATIAVSSVVFAGLAVLPF